MKIYTVTAYTDQETLINEKSQQLGISKDEYVGRLRNVYQNTKLTASVIRQRTLALFETLADAEQYVLRGYNDMFENGYYRYGIIEAVEVGGFPISTDHHFYEFKDGLISAIKRPDWAKNTFNYSIG